MRSRSSWIILAAATIVAVAACGAGPAAPETYAIDCVAVLGMLGQMPLTQKVPPSSMPYSGVPRDKVIADLSDAEIGKLADFETCIVGNGYRHVCYFYKSHVTQGIDGSFRLNTVPLIAETSVLDFCYSTQGGPSADSIHSREVWASIMRRQFGDCPVAGWEDCDRENGSGAFPPPWGPTCASFRCGPGGPGHASGGAR